MLPGVGHAPHREAPAETLQALAEFYRAIMLVHEGAEDRAA
jgi:pimeloyl-ACP methyl ester carboxylesterase